MALAAVSAWPAGLAAQEEPIRIGFSMALTGGLAGAGKPALIAMEIWRDDVNAAGGLLGRQVELVYYDDQTQPANVPKIYTKLLNVDNVDLVVSGYGTNMIAPAMPIIMRKGMVFMSLFGLGANEQFNYDRYFQIMPAGPEPKEDWSRPFIELATEQGLETIALVGADAEFSQNALDGARTNAKAAGLEIVYDKSYPPNTADFTPVIRAIQATNPDVVFVGSYPPDSAGMVRAANELEPRDQAVRRRHGRAAVRDACRPASGRCSTASSTTTSGCPSRRSTSPASRSSWPSTRSAPRARASTRSATTCRRSPTPTCRCWARRSRRWARSTRQALAGHIRDHEFETVVGPVKFGPNGEWATSRVLMVQFQNIENGELEQFKHAGKRVVLLPEAMEVGRAHVPLHRRQRNSARRRQARPETSGDGAAPERDRLGPAARRLLRGGGARPRDRLRPARHRQHRPSGLRDRRLLRRLHAQRRASASTRC